MFTVVWLAGQVAPPEYRWISPKHESDFLGSHTTNNPANVTKAWDVAQRTEGRAQQLRRRSSRVAMRGWMERGQRRPRHGAPLGWVS